MDPLTLGLKILKETKGQPAMIIVITKRTIFIAAMLLAILIPLGFVNLIATNFAVDNLPFNKQP